MDPDVQIAIIGNITALIIAILPYVKGKKKETPEKTVRIEGAIGNVPPSEGVAHSNSRLRSVGWITLIALVVFVLTGMFLISVELQPVLPVSVPP